VLSLFCYTRISSNVTCDRGGHSNPLKEKSTAALDCLSIFSPSLIADYIFDAFLLADCVIRPRYFAFRRFDFEEKKEKLVMDWRLLFAEYFPSSSSIVFAAYILFPFELLAVITRSPGLLLFRCV
jgi:hypothetical protein